MTYRITIYKEETPVDITVEPMFEQRVETLDLRRVFEAINHKPRKPRTPKIKPEITEQA